MRDSLHWPRSVVAISWAVFTTLLGGCQSDEEKAENLVDDWGHQVEERRDHVCGCLESDTAKNTCKAAWSAAIEAQFNELTRECIGEATKEAPDATLDILRCHVSAQESMTSCVQANVQCDDDSQDNRDRYEVCSEQLAEDEAKCPGFPPATQEAVAQCVANGGPQEGSKK